MCEFGPETGLSPLLPAQEVERTSLCLCLCCRSVVESKLQGMVAYQGGTTSQTFFSHSYCLGSGLGGSPPLLSAVAMVATACPTCVHECTSYACRILYMHTLARGDVPRLLFIVHLQYLGGGLL